MGLTLLGLWAFNSRRLEPALGVEEVQVLATSGATAPPVRDVDSLAELATQRENAREAMADEIAADSLALIALVAEMPDLDLDGIDRPGGTFPIRDSAGRDSSSAASAPPPGLPLVSPDRHFAYATSVVDSTWPWARTIPSRERQRAVEGEAERVRVELDAYREETQAWATARVKLRRSWIVKGVAIALFVAALGVTWVWFGRPRREDALFGEG